jgi:hypothetical protein
MPGAMELFSAEKIAEVSGVSKKPCRFCGETQEIVRVIVDSDSGHSIQMFECECCGERNWDD